MEVSVFLWWEYSSDCEIRNHSQAILIVWWYYRVLVQRSITTICTPKSLRHCSANSPIKNWTSKQKVQPQKKLSKTTISDTENELLRPNPFYKKCTFWHHQECVASFLPMVNQAKRNDAKKETNTLFEKNNTLFMRKRHVVWEKTTRCLWENDTSVEEEQGEKNLKRKILRREFLMMRRVKVGILKIHHFHRKCDSNKC